MENKLTVKIYSFSYHKSGYPKDDSGNNGGFVFDCRFLPNPGREKEYMQLSGKDDKVIAYFSKYHIIGKFLNQIFEIANAAVDNYQSRGFESLMFSFGCTGGQHRSVYCAENLAYYLQENNIPVILQHIELEKM